MTKLRTSRGMVLSIFMAVCLILGVIEFGPSLLNTKFPLNLAWLALASTTRQLSQPAWIPGKQLENDARLDVCSKLAVVTPENRSARRCKGLALWLSGHMDEAIDFWQQIGSPSELQPSELYYLGWGLEAQGRFQEADHIWQQAEIPASAFLVRYASERMRSGSSLQAMRLAELTARSEPDNPTNWLRVAAEYGDHGKVEEAVTAWNKAASMLQPNQPSYWWALGRAHYVQREWQEAAANFAKGIEIDPGNREMWRHYYLAYLFDSDYSHAADVAIRWSATLPADTEAYVSAGRAFYLDGNDRAANQWEERALVVDPSSAEAHRWLGAIAMRQGNRVLAREHLNRAIEADPQDAEAYFDLAKLAVDEHDLARAYALAERAIALYRWGCPSAWYVQLGEWAQTAGDTQQAIHAYRQAIQCDPSLTSIRETLERLVGDAPTQNQSQP